MLLPFWAITIAFCIIIDLFMVEPIPKPVLVSNQLEFQNNFRYGKPD